MNNLVIFVTALSIVAAGMVIGNQNANREKQFANLCENLFNTTSFTIIDEANFENIFGKDGCKTIYNFLPNYVKDTHIVLILNASQNHDYKLVIRKLGYEKNVLIIKAAQTDDLNPKQLLLDGWHTSRTRVGVAEFKENTMHLTTNLNLDRNKICTGHFFEHHSNYGTKRENVTKHHLSKTDSKKLCRLRVSWVRGQPFVNDITRKDNPGLMVSMLRIYEQKRNIKVDFQKLNDVYQNEFTLNGTFWRMRRDLAAGRHDVAIGHLFMNSTNVAPFHYGPVFFNDSAYMVLRKEKNIKNYRKLIGVFSKELWTNFLIAFFLVVFTYFMISCLVGSQNLDLPLAFLEVLGLTLGSGLSTLPTSASLRLLLMFYSSFCIIIDNAYLGKLSSVFTDASYSVNADKFKNLLYSGGRLQFSWYMERLGKLVMVGSRNFVLSLRIGSGMVNLTEGELLKHVAHTQANGTIVFLSTLVTHPSETQLVENFHLPASYLTLFATFYIRNGSHLKNSLQFWSNEMFEKGFILKWMRDIIEENRNNSLLLLEKKEAVSLKLAHFEEIFSMLVVGYGFGAVVLVLEIFYKWMDDRFAVTPKLMFIVGLLKPPPINA